MTYFELKQKLKQKQIPSVCLLYGTESYFIQTLKQLFIKAIGNDDENVIFYDLEDTPIQEVITDAETYPFFGGKKLIIASNPVFLKAKPDKLAFDHHLSTLENYLNNPVDYSIIVFIAPYEKIDERKKISKLLKKKAITTECNSVKPHELNKWITNMADQLHIEIHPDATAILETELSTNLMLMENELAKLALFVGEKGTVTKAIAEQMVSHSAESSALKLVDAVIERNLSKAIAIYKDLEKMKEEPIAILGLLAFQFRTLLRVKLLKQKGYGQAQIQKNIGGHPFVIKLAMNREKQFSIGKLESIIEQLAQTDAIMKQGKMEKNLAFVLLLQKMITAA